jgi:AraC-like DNA-binding protein
MNDEAAGLLEKPMRLGTFGLIAKASLTCENVGETLRHFQKSHNLFDNGIYHDVREEGEHVIYSLHRRSAFSVRNSFIVESLLMTIHRFLCWLCAARIELHSVSVDYGAPPWVSEYRFMFFNTLVHFNQRDIAMVFNKKDMRLRIQRDIHGLDEYIRRAPRDIFTPNPSDTLSQKTRREMVKSMRAGHGMPSIEAIAEHVELHPQTLRRRLKLEETDFTEIRTQVRRDVAIYLLGGSEFSIEQIALLLGYSEASPFIRAFKEWMGMTPFAYRQM